MIGMYISEVKDGDPLHCLEEQHGFSYETILIYFSILQYHTSGITQNKLSMLYISVYASIKKKKKEKK